MKNVNEFIDFLRLYDVVSFMILIGININGYKFWKKNIDKVMIYLVKGQQWVESCNIMYKFMFNVFL